MAPPTKHPSTRQRRNRVAGATTLRAVTGKPTIPDLPNLDWHRQTIAWWNDVWSSPMSSEYDDSDRHGLFILAVLVDQFWVSPSKELAGEIRLQRQCYGLTSLDRRRLQWEVERGDQAEERTAQRRKARTPKAAAGPDPRALLA